MRNIFLPTPSCFSRLALSLMLLSASVGLVGAQPKAPTGTALGPGPGQPGPTVTASLGTICQGGSAVLTAYPGAVTSANISYAWSPNVALSATSGAQVVVNPLQTTTCTPWPLPTAAPPPSAA